MQTISEEICGEYLKNILKCDFVSYNIINPDIQGEIDVVGIKLLEEKVFVCEVAAHTKGLNYNKNNQPDNFNRFYSKFKKDIEYAQKYFSGYTVIPMLWSPIVKISGPKAHYNTYNELIKLKEIILSEFDLDLHLVINKQFDKSIKELKSFSLEHTAHFSSSVMRLFQIEENLSKHLLNLEKRK